MKLLVPYDGSMCAGDALREACRVALPPDTIVVMAHVRAGPAFPHNRQGGTYYRLRLRAERQLRNAREQAERFGYSDPLPCMIQVEAPNRHTAIVAAARRLRVDRIILTLPGGWRGQLLLMIHPLLRALERAAPCQVQFTFARSRRRAEDNLMIAGIDNAIKGGNDAHRTHG